MRRKALLLSWLATDIVLFIGAYISAYFLRVGLLFSTDFPIDRYLKITLAIAPLWLLTLAVLGCFRLTRVQAQRRNILYILFASILALSLFTLAYYFVYTAFFSRRLLVYAGILSFAVTALWHLAFDQWQRQILRKNPPAFPLLIIGSNRDAERMIRLLEESRSVFKPVAVLDSRGTSTNNILGIPILGRLNKIEEVIRQHRITHILQCDELEHTINLMGLCRKHRITYLLLPIVLGDVGARQHTEIMEGQPVIMV